MREIDVAIIGAGPAGLTAGIYLGRARLATVVFEKASAGGQMGISEMIENYPGFPEGISGAELGELMRKQAAGCGAEIVTDEVTDISGSGKNFILKTTEGKEYKAMAVIMAQGAQPKKLGIPGEDKFTGRGVSYCATCDAPLFKGKTVLVVGGGDTAAQEALFLAKYCAKVYLVHRRDRLRAAKILSERLAKTKNIEPLWNSVLLEILGDKKVTQAKIKQNDKEKLLVIDGVFVFTGIAPNTELAKKMVKIDKDGYIITDSDMKTSLDGVFACGDVRKKLLWQIVTACADGATAAVAAQHYVETLKGTVYI